MSPEEAGVIRVIVATANVHRSDALLQDLHGAVVSNSTSWILDVKVSGDRAGADLPDGPFPARAFVPSRTTYEGEIIIWIANGHVSGLEYAWVTQEPPSSWPRADQIEVIPGE